MTRVAADALGLPPTGIPVLRELIHERTGLSFEDARLDLLAERMAPLVIARGFRSFLDLYYLLKYDESAADGWRDVMDALSVPETYFWREIDQIRAVVCHVVPALARRTGVIRIWSVPCASGEEPLTIAMALEEAGWFDRVPIEIYGSDGSPLAIAKARAARYRQRSMRALPPALLDKYFAAEPGGVYAPRPWLAQRITSWSVVNLMAAAEVAPLATVPIVFCRNAFIYFSPKAIKRVVDQLAAAMPSPGYLCVGASESLLNVTTAFALEEIDRAFVYVKRGVSE